MPATKPDPSVPAIVGDRVLYRFGGSEEDPVLRPAVVVRTFPGAAYVNLAIDIDGQNDAGFVQNHEAISGRAWRTSVSEGTAVNTFRR